jgi:hypothetical protein
MDIQRSILIVVAIIVYMMVLQWNRDYGQTALPTEIRPPARCLACRYHVRLNSAEWRRYSGSIAVEPRQTSAVPALPMMS